MMLKNKENKKYGEKKIVVLNFVGIFLIVTHQNNLLTPYFLLLFNVYVCAHI